MLSFLFISKVIFVIHYFLIKSTEPELLLIIEYQIFLLLIKSTSQAEVSNRKSKNFFTNYIHLKILFYKTCFRLLIIMKISIIVKPHVVKAIFKKKNTNNYELLDQKNCKTIIRIIEICEICGKLSI